MTTGPKNPEHWYM